MSDKELGAKAKFSTFLLKTPETPQAQTPDRHEVPSQKGNINIENSYQKL
jgi:hypothetical protein